MTSMADLPFPFDGFEEEDDDEGEGGSVYGADPEGFGDEPMEGKREARESSGEERRRRCEDLAGPVFPCS